MGTRNDDISLKLAKAVKSGFLPDVYDSEVDILAKEAYLLFGADEDINANPIRITVTVKKDGTGEFTDPVAAYNSIAAEANFRKLYTILVYPGTYDLTPNWKPNKYVTVEGTDAKRSILSYTAPVDSSDATIAANSTIWLEDTASVKNITLVCDGGQYVVHSEKAGANVKALHDINNVTLIHKGYANINVYRAANSIALYTGSANVWGCGLASGVKETLVDSSFHTAQTGASYWHNNANFTEPAEIDITRCVFSSAKTNANFTIHGLGSGTNDKLNIKNSQLGFMTIQEVDNDWRRDDYANHSDWTISLNNCNPVGYYNTTRGQALRLSSKFNGSEGSSLTISGTVIPVIFGTVVSRPYIYSNNNSVEGNVYGTLDVSGIVLGAGLGTGKTLGVRLGDRTAAPLSLTITNAGNYSETISFNTDFSAMTNAQVISWMDAALGGFVGIDLVNPSLTESYPYMGGHESTLLNDGTVTLHRFQAVVYKDNTRRAIRRMEIADAAALFAGIALEPFTPGRVGRILHRGFMRGSQMRGWYTAIADGTVIYASDTGAGDFKETGTRQLATGVNSEYAYFHAPASK